MSKGALKGVMSVLKRETEKEEALMRMIRSLKGRIDRGESDSSVVSVEDISQVVADLSKDSEDLAKEGMEIFDSFRIPRIKYNAARKEFFSRKMQGKFPADGKKGHGRRLHAEAGEKMSRIRDRFVLVHQRLMRHEIFSPPVAGSKKKDFIKITPIESVRGSAGRKCILGVLSQIEEGTYYLEDLNSHIGLDLSRCNFHQGFFTENCIVLCEGEIDDDVFCVSMMGFPPPEKREQTLKLMSNVDYLNLAPDSQDYIHMRALEERADDSMFVVASNVHLDRPQVFQKLREMFEGFSSASDVMPTAFVFTGNFLSRPFGHSFDDMNILKSHFDQLATLIAGFPNLRKSSKFVFVPGPSDPSTGHPNVLPRPAIPAVFTKRLRSVLQGNAVFATNPCRIRFFTQEIVIMRENILHKMQRATIANRNPSESAAAKDDGVDGEGEEKLDATDHLVKTILDQGHLCPLSLDSRPTYWANDHALWLYPLPDLVLLADNFDQWSQCYEDCLVANPGIFSTDFSFVLYRPTSGKVEFSRINSD